jgi:hypothetical protein
MYEERNPSRSGVRGIINDDIKQTPRRYAKEMQGESKNVELKIRVRYRKTSLAPRHDRVFLRPLKGKSR